MEVVGYPKMKMCDSSPRLQRENRLVILSFSMKISYVSINE